ncbi:M15 family metallopeptidase [Motilibacter aurantiacus]|uniref:M15 family metallopeptidase n=1 Tax=Motilibacter aurantiacus TaxID=2714955 RepID=UPI001409E0C0|nr:M15 family metallopeptidase [Motilibacter aurantiacus]NHC44486.1 M15 family metallopeptidase [Motilibacter aurantiacus]
MTTLIADPDVVAIPVEDNGDPLVDLATCGIACAEPGSDRRHVRSTLADRLLAADAALPPGVRLLVVEGLRTARAQAAVLTGYTRELRTTFPWLGSKELRRLATRYVAPLEVAPHVAGAAVDVTLADAFGRELWMGTELDATPEESGGRCAFDADVDPEARRNRILLARALGDVGLVNYPTEWWHWSFGDRYWAFVSGADRAIYGPVER